MTEIDIITDDDLRKALRHRAGLVETTPTDAYVMMKAEQRLRQLTVSAPTPEIDQKALEADRDSIRIAKQFAGMYRSGAHGAEMDCDAAQALALSIEDILAATTSNAAETAEPVAWASEEAIRKLAAGSPTAIDAIKDGDANIALYAAPQPLSTSSGEDRAAIVEECAKVVDQLMAGHDKRATNPHSITEDAISANGAAGALEDAAAAIRKLSEKPE